MTIGSMIGGKLLLTQNRLRQGLRYRAFLTFCNRRDRKGKTNVVSYGITPD
jgi:hypothetical protein